MKDNKHIQSFNEHKENLNISDVRSKRIIKENEQEELFLAKKYVDDMIEKYGDYKTIRKNILSNLVNSEYGRASNSFVTKVWNEFNKKFPS